MTTSYQLSCSYAPAPDTTHLASVTFVHASPYPNDDAIRQSDRLLPSGTKALRDARAGGALGSSAAASGSTDPASGDPAPEACYGPKGRNRMVARWRQPHHVFHHGASAEAREIRARAVWDTPHPTLAAVPEALTMDVLVVTQRRPVPDDIRMLIHSPEYTTEHLATVFPVVETALLVVEAQPHTYFYSILSLFLTDKEVPLISETLGSMATTIHEARVYYPLKEKTWGLGSTGTRLRRWIERQPGTEDLQRRIAGVLKTTSGQYKITRQPELKKYERGYAGMQFNEGWSALGSWMKKRRMPGETSGRIVRLMTSMQRLERVLNPVAYARRLEAARTTGFGGMVDGVPISDLAATQVGFSVGFACNGHKDSCLQGISESIFWEWPDTPETTPPHTYSFVNYEAGVLFAISARRHCLMFQDGRCVHGSLPKNAIHAQAWSSRGTTYHNGVGAVLVTKSRTIGRLRSHVAS
jgi:hypothetical protein